MKLNLVETADELRACFPVIAQLRTTLTEDKFFTQVSIQQKEGYQLAYIQVDETIVAVAGFRIMHNLAYEKFLYVDDLVTDEKNRSKLYGDTLFDFLIEFAKKEKCNRFHLDSGVQRFDAHRFYLRKRMDIVCHHFGLKVSID